MCIYSLTDYMLLVSVIETFIAIATAVYMHIHLTVTKGSCLGMRSTLIHEKMIVSPASMLVERHGVIYRFSARSALCGVECRCDYK